MPLPNQQCYLPRANFCLSVFQIPPVIHSRGQAPYYFDRSFPGSPFIPTTKGIVREEGSTKRNLGGRWSR